MTLPSITRVVIDINVIVIERPIRDERCSQPIVQLYEADSIKQSTMLFYSFFFLLGPL